MLVSAEIRCIASHGTPARSSSLSPLVSCLYTLFSYLLHPFLSFSQVLVEMGQVWDGAVSLAACVRRESGGRLRSCCLLQWVGVCGFIVSRHEHESVGVLSACGGGGV